MTKDEAKQHLATILPPGARIYTVLRHVSRSGMMRHVDAYAMVDNRPEYLNGYIAALTGIRRTKEGYLKMGGCGYDVGHEVAYVTSSCLYREGFSCIGDRCPSNDHSNRVKTDYHKGGGYALRHEWM